MFEQTVSLANYNKLKTFAALVEQKDFEISLSAGGKSANAKDINEIFKLDLTKPVLIVAKTDSPAAFLRELKVKGLL